ncbi:hypothetical protein O181_119230 [Austropuccinia psidii MF-1]|uniref:Uncharacterized protein n=1 Tax=Austropuccinia psidii MF-1 TaxID=1389203 RepID=A0A9Q3Q056_9BASI|nr:hypothetical protein [Austropuccinia psidii MF-1]
METAFESAKFNSDKDKALPWFCQQKDRLTALYPDMSEFMMHRKILRQCGGDLENAIKRRITEQSSAEDIINILEEVTTRTRIGSSRVNLKARKCHICQSTTHLANTCPKKGKINEIDIEKEPDAEKDDNIEENSDDKSSIFSESSKDIGHINSTFDIKESYSHLPQLSNGQFELSQIQDAQLMKTKPNRGKGYTAGNSCITEVVIDNKPIKHLLDTGAFCSCVGKLFLRTCVPNFKDNLPMDGIKFNSASNPMKELVIVETNIIFPHITGNLRITVELVVMENCSSTHFILGNEDLIIQITVSTVAPVNLELERFKSEQLNEAERSLHLTDNQENVLSALLHDHKGAFASDKEPLGVIIGHEGDIILNVDKPYPPLLIRTAYPASPKSREALEIHIKELLDLGVIRKAGHNEAV